MYTILKPPKKDSITSRFFSSFTACIGLLGWAMLLFILSIIDSAKPASKTIIESTLKMEQSTNVWNYKLLSDAWTFMIILLVVSIFSLIFKVTLCKNKFGSVFFSLLSLILSTTVGMIIFQMKF